MGVVIVTPSVISFPPQVIAPFIQIKPTWQDPWFTIPQLIPTSMTTAVSAQDLSRLVFHRRYGSVMDAYQTDFPADRLDGDLTDWWVRVQQYSITARTTQTVWIGRISGDDATKFMTPAVPAGVQQWVAYGPGQIIRKRAVGVSYHVKLGAIVAAGWVPPLNDPENSELGNRSFGSVPWPATPAPRNVFLYGGDSVWNYRQYIEYLLATFLDENVPVGPEWYLTGELAPLEQLKAPVRWGATQTVYQMLRRLIPLEAGLDYTIRRIDNRTPSQGPNQPEAGFEVFVFAVSRFPAVFAGFTLPGNNNLDAMLAGTGKDLSPPPRIVTSYDRKHKRIRLLGRRIIVCCSLWGANAPDKAQVPGNTIGVPPFVPGGPATNPSSVKKWTFPIESEYDTSSSAKSNDESDQDEHRRQDKYRDVYASFGAPDDWDMNGGTANPWVDWVGMLRLDDPATPNNEAAAPFQQTLRNTLPWIPLKRGEDWTKITTTGGVDRGEATDVDDHRAEYQKPIAWLFDPNTYSFLDSATLGIGVQPQRFDWGVTLQCSPNHIMGDNHFVGVSATQPRYDWEELAITFAFESDQRYTMEWAHPDATAKDGVLEISVDAELHYLAPNTIVAAPFPDSTPAVVLSGNSGRLIREDRQLMGVTMAGAITRYGFGRNRAIITSKGLLPWHDLCGHILVAVSQGAQRHPIFGPITGVTWNMALNGSPSTVIRAGYAS